jgi:predicted Holliday junction resolvase-like endonuclease
MSIQNEFLLFFIILSVILFLLWRKSSERLSQMKFQKHSLSTKYGKITEQFLPFLDTFPYNPSNFRFLGTPIDGVQFEEDKIIFFEFKSNSSHLTTRQNQIKRLILENKIFFEEIYLK